MFVKDVDSELEIELQSIAAKYEFSPEVFQTEKIGNKFRMFMQDLQSEPLATEYGDDPENIPTWIWDEIRGMIEILYDKEGIEYIDITPYNFIEKDDRIYMIDFGDAKYADGDINWFLREFLDGENSWNPDYK